MKKFALLLSIYLFTACSSTPSNEVAYLEPELTPEKLAELQAQVEIDLSGVTGESVISENQEADEESTNPEEDKSETQETTSVKTDKPLEITNLKDGQDVSTPADNSVVFEGIASSNVKSITVFAQGEGYTDEYALTSYFAGKAAFTYRARQDWGNLAEGKNTYKFVATLDDDSQSETSITINYSTD